MCWRKSGRKGKRKEKDVLDEAKKELKSRSLAPLTSKTHNLVGEIGFLLRAVF